MLRSTALSQKIVPKRENANHLEMMNKNVRIIHFDCDFTNASQRTPLRRLQIIQNLIINGFNNSNIIQLKFEKVKNNPVSKSITFPSKTETESRNFLIIFKVISTLVENLKNDYTATRRDIYYQDVTIFKSQSKVDQIIDLLCQSLELKDYEINAVASQKGLFYGNISIEFRDSNVKQDFTVQKTGQAQLIPRISSEVECIKIIGRIKCVLVIEKEAVFNALCQSQSLTQDMVLITGKGYPDRLTKTFLSLISRSHPLIPIIGFADLDPFGLSILKQYKTGGVKSKDKLIESCPALQYATSSIFDFIGDVNCIDLTLNDLKICSRMLHTWQELHQIETFKDYENVKVGLQRMMFFQKKAELDVASDDRKDSVSRVQLDVVSYISTIVSKMVGHGI